MNGGAVVGGLIGLGMAVIVASVVYQLVTHPISVQLASTVAGGVNSTVSELFKA